MSKDMPVTAPLSMDMPVTMTLTAKANKFCYTQAMNSTGSSAMSMASSFQFSLAGGKECVTLWFQAFLFDTKAKFIAAMIGIFLLAVSIEALATVRHFIIKGKRCATYTSNASNARYSKLLVRLTMIVLFSVQSFSAYMLMLSVMTYSAELMIATILGLATGYAVFFEPEESKEGQTWDKKLSHTFSTQNAAEFRSAHSDGNCRDNDAWCDHDSALSTTFTPGGPVNSV